VLVYNQHNGAGERKRTIYLNILFTHQCALGRVVGYGPFCLWVIHKEGLCPSSGDINRLMMMMKYVINLLLIKDGLRGLRCFFDI
jgi:hypothetical protein